jgi:putative inorganic carbon (HCO3(-)) transporter
MSATDAAAPATAGREASLLRYSRWMLIVTIGALPLYVVRWHYGPLPTTLLETLILITFGLYVVARWRDGGLRHPLRTPYDIPILLLIVAASISVFPPPDHRAALGLYRAFFIEPVLIFYIAVDLLRGEQYLRRAVVSFAIGSSLFAVLNLVAFAHALINHTVHVGGAPNALYGDANYVAMYMEPPVAFAMALVLFDRTPRWRWLGAAWLSITGLALLLTLSKGAYLALVLLGVVVILRLRRWMLPLLIGLVGLAFLVSRIPLVAQRISTSENSLVGRFQIYGATIRLMQDHPIFGYGIGGFDYIYRRKTPQPYPHDIWLTFWVELGLVGLIAFAIIFFGLLWRGWRALPKTEGFYRVVLWGVLGALVLWGIHGLADTPYWKNDMAVEFWVLAAIEVVAIWSFTAKSKPLPAPPEP